MNSKKWVNVNWLQTDQNIAADLSCATYLVTAARRILAPPQWQFLNVQSLPFWQSVNWMNTDDEIRSTLAIRHRILVPKKDVVEARQEHAPEELKARGDMRLVRHTLFETSSTVAEAEKAAAIEFGEEIPQYIIRDYMLRQRHEPVFNIDWTGLPWERNFFEIEQWIEQWTGVSVSYTAICLIYRSLLKRDQVPLNKLMLCWHWPKKAFVNSYSFIPITAEQYYQECRTCRMWTGGRAASWKKTPAIVDWNLSYEENRQRPNLIGGMPGPEMFQEMQTRFMEFAISKPAKSARQIPNFANIDWFMCNHDLKAEALKKHSYPEITKLREEHARYRGHFYLVALSHLDWPEQTPTTLPIFERMVRRLTGHKPTLIDLQTTYLHLLSPNESLARELFTQNNIPWEWVKMDWKRLVCPHIPTELLHGLDDAVNILSSMQFALQQEHLRSVVDVLRAMPWNRLRESGLAISADDLQEYIENVFEITPTSFTHNFLLFALGIDHGPAYKAADDRLMPKSAAKETWRLACNGQSEISSGKFL